MHAQSPFHMRAAERWRQTLISGATEWQKHSFIIAHCACILCRLVRSPQVAGPVTSIQGPPTQSPGHAAASECTHLHRLQGMLGSRRAPGLTAIHMGFSWVSDKLASWARRLENHPLRCKKPFQSSKHVSTSLQQAASSIHFLNTGLLESSQRHRQPRRSSI